MMQIRETPSAGPPTTCRCRWGSHWLAILALSFAGCGGEDLPPTAPVTGIVTYKGQPVEGATVLFTPTDAVQTNQSAANTDADGRYTLTTFERHDGALIGTHEIAVLLYDPPGLVKKIPGKYGDVKTSKLTAVIKEGPNEVPLVLAD